MARSYWEEIRRRARERRAESEWEEKRRKFFEDRSGEIPEEGLGRDRWRRIAKFGLGSEMRENRYWEKEKDRLYILCGREEETWEHV